MKNNLILRCVIVLSCIVLVCGGLLVAANKLLFVSEETRLGRSLDKLIPNSGAVLVFDIDDSSKNKEIIAFNGEVPSRERIDGRVLKAYQIKDDTGINDGKFVVEAEGKGWSSYSKSLIAFNENGTVYGVVVKAFGSAENLASDVNVNDLSQKIKEASETSGGGRVDASIMQTSATYPVNTVNGILRATNIATFFFKEVIKGIAPTRREPIELVSDASIIARLDALLANDSQAPSVYYEFPAVKINTAQITDVGTGSSRNEAGIVTTYLTADNQIILHMTGNGYAGSAGGFGAWEVLLLMNENDLIQAVSIIDNSAHFNDEGHGILAQLSDAYLTQQLRNKTAAYLKSDNGMPYSGSVTQTNNGIKVVAYLAVTKCADMRASVLEILTENELPSAQQAQ